MNLQKNLSDALFLITKGGENFGFSRNELAYLDLKDIFCLKKTPNTAPYTPVVLTLGP